MLAPAIDERSRNMIAAMGGTFILIGVLLAIILAGYSIYYLIFKLK